MRVITGTARGRKLLAPEGLDTRPSSDMTKQAVFNILQNYVEGSVFLDLFAGSGQMGIEALSRGARSATFIDASPKAIAVIKENLKKCGMMDRARVAMMESAGFLQGSSQQFDLAFLDPPYQKGLMEQVLPLLEPRMAPAGIVVCETERREELPEQMGAFVQVKTYFYGKAKLTVYRRPAQEGPGEEGGEEGGEE